MPNSPDFVHHFANISCSLALEIKSYKPANGLIVYVNQMLNRKSIKNPKKVKEEKNAFIKEVRV